jgi:hypothetical protein
MKIQDGSAYSLPGQFLGPTENGCIASLLSLSYFLSPSQRSGANAKGSVKFCVAVLMQYWLIQTTVCDIPSQSERLRLRTRSTTALTSGGTHCPLIIAPP